MDGGCQGNLNTERWYSCHICIFSYNLCFLFILFGVLYYDKEWRGFSTALNSTTARFCARTWQLYLLLIWNESVCLHTLVKLRMKVNIKYNIVYTVTVTTKIQPLLLLRWGGFQHPRVVGESDVRVSLLDLALIRLSISDKQKTMDGCRHLMFYSGTMRRSLLIY